MGALENGGPALPSLNRWLVEGKSYARAARVALLLLVLGTLFFEGVLAPAALFLQPGPWRLSIGMMALSLHLGIAVIYSRHPTRKLLHITPYMYCYFLCTYYSLFPSWLFVRPSVYKAVLYIHVATRKWLWAHRVRVLGEEPAWQ